MCWNRPISFIRPAAACRSCRRTVNDPRSPHTLLSPCYPISPSPVWFGSKLGSGDGCAISPRVRVRDKKGAGNRNGLRLPHKETAPARGWLRWGRSLEAPAGRGGRPDPDVGSQSADPLKFCFKKPIVTPPGCPHWSAGCPCQGDSVGLSLDATPHSLTVAANDPALQRVMVISE